MKYMTKCSHFPSRAKIETKMELLAFHGLMIVEVVCWKFLQVMRALKGKPVEKVREIRVEIEKKVRIMLGETA